MSQSVKSRFFSGLFWTSLQSIALKLLGFIFTVFLTRLLTPGDYGLIGMLTIFIAISEVFILSGFGDALIQKKDCSDSDFSTAFYFNLSIACIIYIILFISAPLIANFYHEQQLVVLMRVLALNFVLGSLNIVQQAKLTKAMNFKPLALISLICVLVSGCIGVLMAYYGFGVWALVAQTLTSTLLRVLIFPFFTQWHPNRPFSIESFKQLWHFGSRLLVTGIIGVVIRNISSILIGRYYDKDQVGFFSRSQHLASVPGETLFSVLSSVTYPALCEFQDNQERWIGAYRKVLFNTVLIVCPVILLLVLLSEPIVIILFTEKWASCIPLLQALLLARMFLPIGATHTSLLRSAGDTTLYMNLYLITGPLSLIAVLVSIPFGVVAMAWATFVGALISYLIPAFVIGRKFGYTLGCQLWDWRYIYVALIIMSVFVWLSCNWLGVMWLKLIVGGLVGVASYLVCCKLFNLVDDDLKQLLLSKLGVFRR